jgi:thiamine biosynthesis lipoprotein ApbE
VARGASGALVNLGGDLRAAGDPPRADGWSVDAAEGWTAEVLAKAAFLAGAAGALALLEGKGLGGVVLGRDGRVLRTA